MAKDGPYYVTADAVTFVSIPTVRYYKTYFRVPIYSHIDNILCNYIYIVGSTCRVIVKRADWI